MKHVFEEHNIWWKKIDHLVNFCLGFTDPLVGAHQDCFVIFEICLRLLWHVLGYVKFRLECRCVLLVSAKATIRKVSRELGAKSKVLKLSLDTWKFRKRANRGFGVFAKVKGGWPISKSMRNVLPILLAVLTPCRISIMISQTHPGQNIHSIWFLQIFYRTYRLRLGFALG